jgi:hypothetical protein
MTMSITVLQGLIKSELLSLMTGTLLDDSQLSAFSLAIATAVVTHITTDAVVHAGPYTGNIT